jgi:predicted nucleic-acid-binding protein
VRITADTNVLVRAALEDDPAQAQVARETLDAADLVAVTLPALCEFVWVVGRGYRRPAQDIVEAIRRLLSGATVNVDWPAVEAGLDSLSAGGDFADAVIAFEGRRRGGTVFASFDGKAVALIAAKGGETRMLTAR